MKLILNGANGEYLRVITDNTSFADKIDKVIAVVAYASERNPIFDWCLDNKVPLEFIGRLDEFGAISFSLIDKFFKKNSPNFICRLVQNHHAKVIVFEGFGIYIGSANLSERAWNTNAEAGVFFEFGELNDEFLKEIFEMIKVLRENSSPLSRELYEHLSENEKKRSKLTISKDFWNHSAIKKWEGFVISPKKTIEEKQKITFLGEWYETLQIIRNIADLLKAEGNLPIWVNNNCPSGSLADQFLHSHYYSRVMKGNRAYYDEWYESNKNEPEKAVQEAIKWWRKLTISSHGEERTLNEISPKLKDILSIDEISKMDFEKFQFVVQNIHSMREFARRAKNHLIGINDEKKSHSIEEKIPKLAFSIWNDEYSDGAKIISTLEYVLYGGNDHDLPNRIWECAFGKKKVSLVGLSAIGEIVGWARPNEFPPRNGRTSKALRSLGYNVKIYSE